MREKIYREYEFERRQLVGGKHRQHGVVGLANRAASSKSPVHGSPPSVTPCTGHRAVQSLPPCEAASTRD